VAFLGFLHVTCVNKLDGLSEQQARATPLATSPAVSALGVIKHLTSVQRQHIQHSIGGCELPSLWAEGDDEHEWRVRVGETISSVIADFDAEWVRSQETMAEADWDAEVLVHGSGVRVGRLLVDVLQEQARHVGHLDVVRELIDGSVGE